MVHAAHHRVGIGDVVVERHGVLHLYSAVKATSMRFSSPVSRNDSSETFAFWNQNRSALAVRAAKPVPAHAWAWVPGQAGRGCGSPPRCAGCDRCRRAREPRWAKAVARAARPEVTVDDPPNACGSRPHPGEP